VIGARRKPLPGSPFEFGVNIMVIGLGIDVLGWVGLWNGADLRIRSRLIRSSTKFRHPDPLDLDF
jgi:hypothetical protein